MQKIIPQWQALSVKVLRAQKTVTLSVTTGDLSDRPK